MTDDTLLDQLGQGIADRISRAQHRYIAAMHAVQTGVLLQMQRSGARFADDRGPTSPKHLRVGVNAAMVDSGALASLLIRKGLISEVEYHEALAAMAEREAASYERDLPEGVHLG